MQRVHASTCVIKRACEAAVRVMTSFTRGFLIELHLRLCLSSDEDSYITFLFRFLIASKHLHKADFGLTLALSKDKRANVAFTGIDCLIVLF